MTYIEVFLIKKKLIRRALFVKKLLIFRLFFIRKQSFEIFVVSKLHN